MIARQEEIAFCSLAYGGESRRWAKILAGDLKKFFPEFKYVIHTDKPADFDRYDNVIAYKYQRVDPHIYADKVNVLRSTLLQCRTVISLDADIRIVKDSFFPKKFPEGITAVSCCSLKKHVSDRGGGACK